VLLFCDAVPKTSTLSENAEEDDNKDGGSDKGIVKVTKAERRAKLKKQKRESKKQGKELDEAEEVQQTPQAAVLVLSCAFFFLMLLSKLT
jgi:nucleolar complex protein 3